MELDHTTDHTILRPKVAEAAVQEITDEVKEHDSFSVRINPRWVAFANKQLANIDIAVCIAIGSPSGVSTPEVKAYEATDAAKDSANEMDMVISIGALKSQQYDHIRQDIQGVVDAVKGKTLAKMVIETAPLIDEGKVKAYELAKEAGADLVRTSTDFSVGGAKVTDIHLTCGAVGPDMGVGVSGSVHNAKEALTMIKAGATHIGVSTDVAIVSGATGEGY